MTAYVNLFNASMFLDLTASPYGIRPGGGLGVPEVTRVFSRPWGRGYAALAGETHGNRQAPVVIKITGTSLDNWIVNVRQLAAILADASRYHESGGAEGDPAYLSVQMDGATNATVWDVEAIDVDAARVFNILMTRTTNPQQVEVPLTLTLRPWGRPQALTRTVSGTLTNGDSAYTLSALAGDRPAPLRVGFQSAAGDAFRAVVMGMKSRGNVSNFIWVMECETGSYTGYTVTNIETSANFALSNVAVAAAHGGNVLRIQNAGTGAEATMVPLLRWSINDNVSDFYGKYRVYLRVDNDSNVVNAYQFTYGGTDGTDIVLSTVTKSNPTDGLHYLGIMEIPHRRQPGDRTLASFNFTLRVTTNNNTSTGDYDCIYLVPVDEAFMHIQLSANASAQDQLINDNLQHDPHTYLLDSTGDVQPEQLTITADSHFRVLPGRDSLWCVLVLQAASLASHDLTDQFTLTFEHYPLYELLR